MFRKSGAFGLSTIAAGFIIRPALSRVHSRPSYLLSTGYILDTVYKPPDGVGWFMVNGHGPDGHGSGFFFETSRIL